MKKEVLLGILYDYYGELLTTKQQRYFEEYYFNNMSLGEAAVTLHVSRNAVHKQLKVIEEKLVWYETTLGLYQRDKELKKVLEDMPDSDIKTKIEKIIEIGE